MAVEQEALDLGQTERRLEAQSKWTRAARTARRTTPVTISGIGDTNALAYNYGSMHEVMTSYFRGIDRKFDHQLVTEDNPLKPYLDNLERRNR